MIVRSLAAHEQALAGPSLSYDMQGTCNVFWNRLWSTNESRVLVFVLLGPLFLHHRTGTMAHMAFLGPLDTWL